MEIERAKKKLEIIENEKNKDREEEISKLEKEANKIYD